MGNVFTNLRNAPKRVSALLAVIGAVLLVPSMLHAWGPGRPTYTTAHPADHVVFNSITDNPEVGDERNFVRVKEAGAPNSTYADAVNLVPGKKYTVYMYYHNNAASNLNASGKGIAKDVSARAEIPAIVKSKSSGTQMEGFINTSNSNIKSVWDEAAFNNSTDGDIALRLVPGSAALHNSGKLNGAKLPDSIITSGAAIGYDTLGVVPGCNQYAGYVTFDLVADQANFEVSKQVRMLGEDSSKWRETAATNPGDKVEYLIHYKNTGTTQQNNVSVVDTLPKGVSYVPGTTKIKNALNPNGKSVSDNVVTTNGLNISNYTPGSDAYVWFTAQVDSADKLPCGPNTLVNKATVVTNNGNKSDTADVTVTGNECKNPVYTCDALSVTKVSRTNFTFNTTYTVKDATFKNVTYVVKDAQGKEVYRGTDANYTQEKAGKYTVQAIVTVTVDGVDKTATSENCTKPFEVVPLPPEEIEVCKLDDKTIVVIKKDDFDASKYSKNLNDCKEKMCPIPGKENLPADSKDCKKVVPPATPTTPTELPTTGPADAVMSILGLGALIASIGYYISSRRALLGR